MSSDARASEKLLDNNHLIRLDTMGSKAVDALPAAASSSADSADTRIADEAGRSAKRWILALILFCVLLFTALIINFIKYKQCCQLDSSCLSTAAATVTNTTSSSPTRLELKESSKRLESDLCGGAHSFINDNCSYWNGSRLPVNFRPSFYEIKLRIDLRERKFNGSCEIRFECVRTTRTIVIHSETNIELKELPVVLNVNSGKILKTRELTVNSFYSYLIIQLEEEMFVERQTYSIYFADYRSDITENLRGIYYSTYSSKNMTKSLIVSQLQPVDARRVFPCFDEPIYKAVFKISIEHQKEFVAISNMPEINSVTLDDVWIRTDFNSTPLMSTYILAFVVSDFKYQSTTGPNGIQIRVWSREEYLNSTNYAIECIPKIFDYFTNYFDIPEVVSKSDHFASPDFNAGAMENWGLIIYKESTLLFDEQKSSLEDEFYVLLVICHEVAHSWFGNMATLKWWDNLWMNEAFANTLMYFAMEHIRPDFRVLDSLVVHDLFNVMEKDSVETTHPVSFEVENPKEVQQYFDEISYDKGLSVLRMLRGFIGYDKFKNSLRNYVRQRKYNNSDMNELFEIFSQTINYEFNISQIMSLWLTQEGYPVVNVITKIDTTYNKIVYEFKQNYFLLHRSETNKKDNKWVIPFTFKFQDTEGELVWLNMTDAKVERDLNANTSNQWILGNLDSYGYFRVNYDINNWKLIIRQLKENHLVFKPTERAQLIHDSFTLARIGELEYPIALDLASYLSNERDYVPWKSFFRSITYLDSMLSSSSCYGLFQNFTVNQIKGIFENLTWEDKGPYLERVLRSNLIKYVSYYDYSKAIEHSLQEFPAYLKGEKSERHMAEAVLCTGIKYNNYEKWVELFERSIDAIPTEYAMITQALVCSREPWVLKGYLEMSLQNNTLLRISDIRRIFTHFSLTAISRGAYFDFVLKYWPDLIKKFGTDAFLIGSILETLAVGVGDTYSLQRVKEMLRDGAGAASNSPSLIISQINSNIQWVRNHERKICDYLNSSN